MENKIPVTVIVTTLNEEKNLSRCLAALTRFDEVIIVDSGSNDNSRAIAQSYGATFIDFKWNGRYPKKRQWCLDTLSLKHTRVFFVDADEEVTPELAQEIATLDWSFAGYFVTGLYVVDGRVMKRGMKNQKLCLLDRRLIEFPIVDDLNIPGMGEIEGHYQPVPKNAARNVKLGKIKNVVLHHALDDMGRWHTRHEGYAAWETGMMRAQAYPKDPVAYRQFVKQCFRLLPLRSAAIFFYYYILKGGFLEGRKNLLICLKKLEYYNTIKPR